MKSSSYCPFSEYMLAPITKLEAAFDLRDPILDIHRRNVDVARHVERDTDAAGAVVAAARRHVQHAGHTVDRLLDRRRDGRLDDLRARAVVERDDLHLRRREIGVL